MTADQLFERACRDLPEGYYIEIELENCSGTASLVRPPGTRVDWYLDERTLTEQIESLIFAAYTGDFSEYEEC